jgi:hypothetical protein
LHVFSLLAGVPADRVQRAIHRTLGAVNPLAEEKRGIASEARSDSRQNFSASVVARLAALARFTATLNLF